MGDSDDEYDRKRRDKFRGERAGTGGAEGNNYRGSDRREERSRGREEWQDRLDSSFQFTYVNLKISSLQAKIPNLSIKS